MEETSKPLRKERCEANAKLVQEKKKSQDIEKSLAAANTALKRDHASKVNDMSKELAHGKAAMTNMTEALLEPKNTSTRLQEYVVKVAAPCPVKHELLQDTQDAMRNVVDVSAESVKPSDSSSKRSTSQRTTRSEANNGIATSSDSYSDADAEGAFPAKKPSATSDRPK